MRPVPVAALVGLGVVVVEVAALVGAAHLVGWPWAIAALVLLSLVGCWLVPRQGIRAWRRFRAEAEQGRPPGSQATDGLVGLAGALLIALPGFVTALTGA